MSAPAYLPLLKRIRAEFPQPVADRTHDAHFGLSVLRALELANALKSTAPRLGRTAELDFDQAMRERIDPQLGNLESVTPDLVEKLEGLPVWGHPHTQFNVVAPPTIPSIIATLLPSIYNPNLVSDDTSHGLAQVEVAVASLVADLVGYSPERATGVFTFGGTGTVLYGVKLGIEKAFRGTMEEGMGKGGILLTSAQSHYSRLSVAGWLGLGERNVVAVPSRLTNDVDVGELEAAARRAIEEGRRIVAIVATMGTTDAFGIDDLEAIVRLRDSLVEEYGLDYRPHVHADAVIGWAWSAFKGYDFEENALGFRLRTVRCLAGAYHRISRLALADSIGVDFHKTGFAPYVSSLFLVKDRSDLNLLGRELEEMPYMFRSGQRHPGTYTLETSRSGGGVLAAWANLRLFGIEGLRVLLGYLVEMAELLREHLDGHGSTSVLNSDNFGTVTLFRAYPDGVDTWTIKERERTDPKGSGGAPGPQRVQSTHLPPPSRTSGERGRRLPVDNGLLSRDGLRRAHRGPQVLHALALHRREARGAAGAERAGGEGGRGVGLSRQDATARLATADPAGRVEPRRRLHAGAVMPLYKEDL